MKASEYKLPKEKFAFANVNDRLHDEAPVTKPISYLKDAFHRFKKNKASIVAAIIIGVLFIFAIFAPIFSQYSVSYIDDYYKRMLPKNPISEKLNLDFWDGCENKELNFEDYVYYNSIYEEIGRSAIKNNEVKLVVKKNSSNKDVTYYQVRLDTYNSVGTVFVSLNDKDFADLQKYQDEKGIQIIYPITEKSLRPESNVDNKNANYWFKTTSIGGKTKADVTVNDDGTINYTNIYKTYTGNDKYTSKMRVEGENNYLYDYSIMEQSTNQIRVNYYEYYVYLHTHVLNDGITKPMFIFGTSEYGQDLFTALASGARFSFILAIVVASVNLIIGAIYGAIEGYYGGKIDLIMERIVEILSAVPFMVVISLLKYHMEGSNQILILFIAFFLTGWIGMAGRTRMQFYRFKNQEYVLSARTLGAKDSRIMFKHIFPNALGTLITSCVLVIPSVIFSETTLSYLGIINLETGSLTSVGTLLAKGQKALVDFPHMILFPSLFICLLMLSFNLFGNGLRDAFNPSLRGTED